MAHAHTVYIYILQRMCFRPLRVFVRLFDALLLRFMGHAHTQRLVQLSQTNAKLSSEGASARARLVDAEEATEENMQKLEVRQVGDAPPFASCRVSFQNGDGPCLFDCWQRSPRKISIRHTASLAWRVLAHVPMNTTHVTAPEH